MNPNPCLSVLLRNHKASAGLTHALHHHRRWHLRRWEHTLSAYEQNLVLGSHQDEWIRILEARKLK